MEQKQPTTQELKQLAQARKEHLTRLKADTKLFEADAAYWEAKFKGLHYKVQFAKLEADLEEELQKAQTQQEKIDISEEALKNMSDDEALQTVMSAAMQGNSDSNPE